MIQTLHKVYKDNLAFMRNMEFVAPVHGLDYAESYFNILNNISDKAKTENKIPLLEEGVNKVSILLKQYPDVSIQQILTILTNSLVSPAAQRFMGK